MALYLFGLENWLPAEVWIVVVVGLAVCGMAFVLGWHMSASRLVRRASVESLDELEANFLNGVTRDRRVAPRRKGNAIEVQIRSALEDPPIRAWVIDRSIGGLCLQLEQPLEEGLVLKVRPK